MTTTEIFEKFSAIDDGHRLLRLSLEDHMHAIESAKMGIVDSLRWMAENRPTIFLSNLAPVDLVPIIGERLVDRIKGKCVAQRFSGESRRKSLTADIFGEAA